MLTMKSPPSRASVVRMIPPVENALTSRKTGPVNYSNSSLQPIVARSAPNFSQDSVKPPEDLATDLQPFDEVEAPILIVDDEPFVADLLYHWVHTVWDYPAIV